MKANRSLSLTLILSVLFLLGSCSDKDDDKEEVKKTENWPINEWIFDEMSEKYFWNDNIPSQSSQNFNDNPRSFFFDMLYRFKQNDGDRFSSLENDGVPYYTKDEITASTSSKTKHNEIGFEFQPFFVNNKGDVELLVTYIKKGTEVEKENILKRGDWITAIDGVSMNEKNWLSLILSGKASYMLTLEDKKTLTLKTTAAHDENPIHTYKIIPNTRIGYVLYNSFANGKDENSYDYAIEMNNEVLTSFEGNIDELILDLRYNGGGLVQSGTYIASAIAPNRSGKIYTRRNYNSTLDKNPSYASSKNNYFYNEITAGRTKHVIPQLNLKRLYVITSKYTASASEQIINGLRAYMTVEVIGETTTGKNMESFPITGKDKASKWILHPLTSVSYRSNLEAKDNNYSKGFPPTVGWQGINGKGVSGYHLENDEFQTLREGKGFFQLGDKNETLLAKAIEHITGKKSLSARSMKKSDSLFLTPIGSSLDLKSNDMIIENPEVNK